MAGAALAALKTLPKKLYAISGGQTPINVSPAIMLTVAGDHGVADQGFALSQGRYPSDGAKLF